MYAAERQQRILEDARREGRVEVVALARTLDVATETVRRDLTALERRGVLRRVHGGAIPVERLALEPPVSDRVVLRAPQKRRIAERALHELPANGTIVLDAGTTTGALVDALPTDIELTVVTNSVSAAANLLHLPNCTVLVLGGQVRPRTGAAVGEWATHALSGLRVDVAFMGTNGLTVAGGLTTPDQAEARVKSAMVAAARRVIVLTDASKVGEEHLHRFAALSQVDAVITDHTLDAESTLAIEAAGPEVIFG